MAGLVESVSAIVYDSDGGSVVSSAPAGVVSGETLWMEVTCLSSSNPTTPTGWDLVGRAAAWYGTVESHLYGRVADGTALDTPTVSCPAAATTIVITRCSGVDTVDPVDDYQNNNGTNDNADPVVSADATSSGADRLALIFFGSAVAWTGSPITFSNGFTNEAERLANVATGVASKSISSSGSVGAVDISSGNSNAQRAGIHTLILNPAAAGGPEATGTFDVSGDAGVLASHTSAREGVGSAPGDAQASATHSAGRLGAPTISGDAQATQSGLAARSGDVDIQGSAEATFSGVAIEARSGSASISGDAGATISHTTARSGSAITDGQAANDATHTTGRSGSVTVPGEAAATFAGSATQAGTGTASVAGNARVTATHTTARSGSAITDGEAANDATHTTGRSGSATVPGDASATFSGSAVQAGAGSFAISGSARSTVSNTSARSGASSAVGQARSTESHNTARLGDADVAGLAGLSFTYIGYGASDATNYITLNATIGGELTLTARLEPAA